MSDIRIFTCDWDKTSDPNALPIPAYKGKGPTIHKFGPSTMIDHPTTMMNFISVLKTPTPKPAGSFDALDLIKDLPEPIILNLEQMSH